MLFSKVDSVFKLLISEITMEVGISAKNGALTRDTITQTFRLYGTSRVELILSASERKRTPFLKRR